MNSKSAPLLLVGALVKGTPRLKGLKRFWTKEVPFQLYKLFSLCYNVTDV